MDDLISNKLKPTESCAVCTEPFDKDHIPVALPCLHIFGHTCIKKWLCDGRGNTNSCPFCRHVIFEHADPAAFDTLSIWKALCEQSAERLHSFLTNIWIRVQKLWRGRLFGNFSTSELLEKVILPALFKTGGRGANPFMDCYHYINATWDSLGRTDRIQGLAVPLARLARLMSQASSALPKWMTTVQRVNMLFWRANASLGMTHDNINWDHVTEAAKLGNPQHFPLLHLYTLLISQSIVHTDTPRELPTRRHEIMNFVVEKCCRKIGGNWNGKPSSEFKDLLIVFFQELKRHQVENGKLSLRGHAGEEHVVTGLWGIAAWRRGTALLVKRSPEASPERARSTTGWSDCGED